MSHLEYFYLLLRNVVAYLFDTRTHIYIFFSIELEFFLSIHSFIVYTYAEFYLLNRNNKTLEFKDIYILFEIKKNQSCIPFGKCIFYRLIL